jgi:hypothetical protein
VNLQSPFENFVTGAEARYYRHVLGYRFSGSESLNLSRTGYTLDALRDHYLNWVNQKAYCVWKVTHPDFGVSWKAHRISRRGNPVYCARLYERLKVFDGLKGSYFDPHDLNPTTKALFVNLTFSQRGKSLDDIWRNIGSLWNLFITKVRKKYGRVKTLRVWEAHGSGMPHIHAVLLFEESSFDVFRHGKKWRTNSKQEISDLWGFGFVDVEGIRKLGGVVSYVRKYLVKAIGRDESIPSNSLIPSTRESGDLTLSMLWTYRKQSFAVSVDWMGAYRNSNPEDVTLDPIAYLFGDRWVTWSFQGVRLASELGVDGEKWRYSFDKPPPSLDVESPVLISPSPANWKKQTWDLGSGDWKLGGLRASDGAPAFPNGFVRSFDISGGG